MSKIFVKPKNTKIQVPNPDDKYRPLPEEGANVTDSRYWQRRIKEGDVVLAKATKSTKSKAV